LIQPAGLEDAAVQQLLRDSLADVIVVAAYGRILPQAVLDIPRLGALNIHASLLPRWRGAAPIARAILAGDAQTGISIMQMDAGLDTGAVLLQGAIQIADEDNAGTLHDRLAELGARQIVAALDSLQFGLLHPRPQPAEGATYAAKIDKKEALIAWGDRALETWHKIRAFNPFPGALTRLGGAEMKIWRARPTQTEGVPGEILAVGKRGILVACGQGGLQVEELQRAGGKRVGAADFLRGHPLRPGDRFDD
jgi:methionyl-tRNA formyltransferase